MTFKVSCAVLALALTCASPVGAEPDHAVLFARCAVCHLPHGEGVPGTYPPFGAQIGRFAQSAAGREYMVTVVTHGLTGPLDVEGVTFNGFMPAQGLSDDEAAAVINYIVHTIVGAGPGTPLFSRTEVATIRSHHASATAQDSRALRPDAPVRGKK